MILDPEIFLVFTILFFALVMFLTGWLRMDIVGLSVLVLLALFGLVSPEEAMSGFSNPAVIVVWAMFILSAAIYHTGVARMIGRQVLKLSGTSEWRIVLTIMVTSGLLSTIMSNIGVTALMLPVVMDIARSTGRSPSRLLIPLAFAAHLGGLTTMIGTPANLLVSYQLEKAGYEPLNILDFSFVGGGVMLVSIAFIVLIGRHLLPTGKSMSQISKNRHKELTESYHLEESSFTLAIREDSDLLGKTLAELRLRPVLGINVLSLQRRLGNIVRNPGPDTLLEPGDQLFVQGRWEEISALQKWKADRQYSPEALCEKILDAGGQFFRITILPDSAWAGKPAEQIIQQSGPKSNILAIKRRQQLITGDLNKVILSEDDELILYDGLGAEKAFSEWDTSGSVTPLKKITQPEDLQPENLIFTLIVTLPAASVEDLPAINLLRSGFGFTVLGVMDQAGKLTLPTEKRPLQRGDCLVVAGNKENQSILNEIAQATLKEDIPLETDSLETEEVIMAEAVLAPRSLMAGKTVKEINFRKKYGVSVVALWREGKAVRTDLHTIPLRFGEALLLYGKKEKITMLGEDNDLILLTDTMQQTFRTGKALLASLILTATLLVVILGYLTLPISVILGVIAMAVTGCIKMEEAYRSIDWRSVFLIAGMLPLGVALEQTGAASLIAHQVEVLLGGSGPWVVLAGLYLITLVANLAIHPAALVVIMAPVVIQTAESLGVSPHSFMIAIAIAASGSFISPVAHPANLLVMGPGGYKFSDYLKIGIPFSLVIMVIVFLLLPLFWPF